MSSVQGVDEVALGILACGMRADEGHARCQRGQQAGLGAGHRLVTGKVGWAREAQRQVELRKERRAECINAEHSREQERERDTTLTAGARTTKVFFAALRLAPPTAAALPSLASATSCAFSASAAACSLSFRCGPLPYTAWKLCAVRAVCTGHLQSASTPSPRKTALAFRPRRTGV